MQQLHCFHFLYFLTMVQNLNGSITPFLGCQHITRLYKSVTRIYETSVREQPQVKKAVIAALTYKIQVNCAYATC